MNRRITSHVGEQRVMDFDPKRRVRREDFYRFHAENAHVWELFESFALELAAAGAVRIGARLVWERLRWEGIVSTSSRWSGPFKLNDHLVPFYARLFLQRHPEHADLFETRRAAADAEFLS